MFELATVIGAFVLYMVVLPIFGMLGAVCCRIFLPYVLGTALVFGLLSMLFGQLGTSTLVLLAFIIWSVPALCVRYWPHPNGTATRWHQGHYRASFAMMTFGLLQRHQPTGSSTGLLGSFGSKLKTRWGDNGKRIV